MAKVLLPWGKNLLPDEHCPLKEDHFAMSRRPGTCKQTEI